MEFVICEDEKVLAMNYKKIVDNFMMNYDMEYTIKLFDGYNDNFEELIKNKTGPRIYILDVRTKQGSGINAARMIREEAGDWVSMIIIITSFSEYKYEVVGKRLMLLDFVSKSKDPEKRLLEDLKICMTNFGNKYNTIKFKYKGIVHNISLQDIIYVEKEQDSKRCIIHTKEKNYYILGTLNDVWKKLDNRFIKTHRSLLVNNDHIDYFKQSTNELFFKNKERTYLVSRDKKKEVIKHVRVVE